MGQIDFSSTLCYNFYKSSVKGDSVVFYRLLEWLADIAFFPILIVLYYVFKAIQMHFKKQKWTFNEWIEVIGRELYGLAGNWSKNLIIASSIALLLTNPVIHHFVGINNLKIKPDGTYCFYVEATRNGSKTYTLPAQIRIEEYREDEDERTTRIYRYYYIERVFFSNGGYLNTEDLDDVDINKPTVFYDKDDNEWELVLLNEHAYTPEVKETNNVSWLSLSLLLIESVSIIIILYALSKSKKPADE